MEMKLDYSDVQFADNGKLKLLIIVGTRPEIIRLAAVINKCRKYFDCILAHTGQNYDYNLNGVFFKDLKLADPLLDSTTIKCTTDENGEQTSYYAIMNIDGYELVVTDVEVLTETDYLNR